MKKILLVTNIPNPYRIPLYNAMSNIFGIHNFKLKIIFGSEGYKRRLFKLDKNDIHFEYEILKDKGHTFSKDGEKTIFLYNGLSKILDKENPDLIIVAGFSTATMKIFKRSLFKSTPYIIVSGTIGKATRKINFLRRIQRKILANHASAFIAYGNLAKQHLIESGVSEHKIFIGRNTVDTSFFEEKTNICRTSEVASGGPVHFTCLGYLVPRKNVMEVLKVVKILSKTENNFIVDIIGDGISKQELIDFCESNHLNAFVKFHGFKQRDEIPQFLAISRGLLFQTDYDIWGLVLNEAMAAGVPCLASPNAGATHDLIQEGVTGFVTDFKNHAVTAQKMKWLIHHPEEAKIIGEAGSDFIHKNVTLTHAVNGYVEAVKFAMAKAIKSA